MLISLGRAAVLASLLALLPAGAALAEGHATAAVQPADCTTVTGLHPGTMVVTGCTDITAAHITGNVLVQPGAQAEIFNSTVDGAVTGKQVNNLVICGSTLGRLTASPAEDRYIEVGDPGDDCAGNTIKGAVRLDGMNQGFVEFVDNHVGGSVTIVNCENN